MPGAWLLQGLAFAAGAVLLSPSEAHTLGGPKPFFALDPQTGQTLWQVESTGIQWTAPAADESLACAVDSRGQVAVVHPRTGQPRWAKITVLGNYPRSGISPALSASYLLLINAAGELLWLSRSNGKEAGRYLPPTGGLDFPPTCVENVAYFCAGAGLYRLDLTNGHSREIFHVPRKSSRCFFASPLVTPLGLLILHVDDPDYAAQLLDPETGQSLWKIPLRKHPYFAPAIEGERVALPDRNGHILLLDLPSGKILHHLLLGDEKPASSPLFQNGELFLLTESGNVLCFSTDLRLEHLPATPQEYLARGEWESAALKYALQGNWNEAARLYKNHKRYPEARPLYELAGNFRERGLLNLHSVDFHLTLRPHEDVELQEDLFALLEVEIENRGIGTAKGVQLTLASDQMDINKRTHRFGEVSAGEKKSWDTLQIRPRAGGGLLLKITLAYKDENGESHKSTFEQGLNVLKSLQPAERVININVGGDMGGNLIVGDGNRIE